MTNQQSDSQPQSVQTEIKYTNDPQQPFLYANQILIRRLPDSVIVSFAVTHGPFELQPDLAEVVRTGIPAFIVAKIAVPIQRFRAFADVFSQVAQQIERGEPSDAYNDSESDSG